jgi:hypothetical protein
MNPAPRRRRRERYPSHGDIGFTRRGFKCQELFRKTYRVAQSPLAGRCSRRNQENAKAKSETGPIVASQELNNEPNLVVGRGRWVGRQTVRTLGLASG